MQATSHPPRRLAARREACTPSRLGLCAFLALAGAAQAAEPVADGRWRGNVTAALSGSSGNTRSSSVLLKADGQRVTDNDKTTLGAAVNQARSRVDGEESVTADKASGYGQYDHDLSRRTVVFGRLALDRDQLALLSLRAAATGGLGWKWVDTEALQVTLYGGLGYTSDRYSEPQTVAGVTGLRFRRANLLFAEESVHVLGPTVRIKHRLEVTPSIGGDRNTGVRLTADLKVALNATMSLSVGVINTYNTEPPAGLDHNDLAVFTGLDIRFGGV